MSILTLDRMIRHHAEERSTKIALNDGVAALSYAELERRARQVAQGLKAAGVGPGDRVAYLGKNTLAYFEWFLGAVKVGAVTVPVNWRLAMPEVAYIVGNASTRLLLAEESFEATAATAAPDVECLVTGGHGDTFGAWRDRQREQDVAHVADWHQPVLQMYTSGTTGHPKGVVLSHRNLFALRTAQIPMPRWFDWSPADVSLIAMPVSHVSGTGWAVWSLQHGATGIVAREFDPDLVFDMLQTHRINKVIMVPTAMQIAVRHPRARSANFSFLEYIVYGAAPLPLALMDECAAVFRCGFVQMYGMTETSGVIVALTPEDHDPNAGDRMKSVGRPLKGVELRIIDAAGNELPQGMTGEIATRSVANMVGYFGMPEATARTIGAEGWLRTGDAGYLDADGYLYLQDRIKDMIISGGENIYPAEVENAIYGHPAVAEVAVIGVPDDKWGESVRAVVVPVAGAVRDDTDVIAWAATRIARYKLPRSIEWVDSLPRNHAGKVLRRVLRDRSRSAQVRESG